MSNGGFDRQSQCFLGKRSLRVAIEIPTGKIARQRGSRPPAGKQLFAVDNQGLGDPSFEGFAAAAQPLAEATQVFWARLADGAPAARDALRLGLQSGVAATHFFGHASFEAWADEHLLDADSVSGLSGTPETVVFAWSCSSPTRSSSPRGC